MRGRLHYSVDLLPATPIWMWERNPELFKKKHHFDYSKNIVPKRFDKS